MDNDADRTAREWLSRSPSEDERDAELVRLRERLAFYQSFDGLIHDNITRSGDLLRQAMQMRESAAAEIAAAKADAERQRTDDRDRYRQLFSGLLDEVTTVQVQAERLARRLTNALDQIEMEGASGPYAALPTDLDFEDSLPFNDPLSLDQPVETLLEEAEALATDDALANLIDPTDDEHVSPVFEPTGETLSEVEASAERDEVVSITSSENSAEHQLPTIEQIDAAIDDVITKADDSEESPLRAAEPAEIESRNLPNDIPLDIEPFAPEDIFQSRGFMATTDLTLRSSNDTESIFPELAPTTRIASRSGSPNATIVLVHGVPRATTALSLKRYLESLAHVGAVEPREFAEGILRLEVSGNRPLAFEDLRSWPEGLRLEPVHLRDDLVEVRLAQ
jgi:hypothetical protein